LFTITLIETEWPRTSLDGGADRSPVGDIDALEDRPALVCGSNFGGGGTTIRLVEVGDHDGKSVFGQRSGDGAPDTARRAGHDCAVALV
jgi:hypothetical protein